MGRRNAIPAILGSRRLRPGRQVLDDRLRSALIPDKKGQCVVGEAVGLVRAKGAIGMQDAERDHSAAWLKHRDALLTTRMAAAGREPIKVADALRRIGWAAQHGERLIRDGAAPVKVVAPAAAQETPHRSVEGWRPDELIGVSARLQPVQSAPLAWRYRGRGQDQAGG